MKNFQIIKYFNYLLVITVYACNPSQKMTKDAIAIDYDRVKTIPLDSIKIKSVQYIPLETSDEALMSGVHKMLVRGNRIYVADYSGAGIIFVFDFQGKLVLKINRVGRGPGEYIQITDFDISESGDIYIWSSGQRKLFKYSQDGAFDSEYTISAPFFNFSLLPNDRLYVNRTYENGVCSKELAEYDLKTNECRQILPITAQEQMLVGHNFFYSPFGCYYIPRFSETAYRLDEKEVIPYIRFENLPLPPESVIEEWKKNPQEMMMDRKYVKNVTSIYETKDYITFFMEFLWPHQIIYQKETGKCVKIEGVYLSMNMGFKTFEACNNDTYFAVIQPGARGVLNTLHKNAQQMPNKEELLKLSEESNPVILAIQFEIP